MFLKRSNKTSGNQPCSRCMILRTYFLAILVLAAFAILAGDKAQYLKFVNKEFGAYMVLAFGAAITVYRVAEWFLFYRPKN